MDDWQCLRQYVKDESHAAFEEIVSRHVDLVYSICRRQVRDAHLAEDATQAVFVILAKKARTLRSNTSLVGWLHHTARYVSANAMRVAANRRKHEMEAAQTPRSSSKNQARVDHADEAVDRALNRLEAAERDAILLRFFEARSFREVGAAMNISEEAAKKRVWRGIEKLRQMLTPAGAASVPAASVVAILAAASHPAPASLASAAAVSALSGSGAAFSLAKGAVIAMAISKTKATAAGIAMMILLMGGAAVVVNEMVTRPKPLAVAVPIRPATQPAEVILDTVPALTAERFLTEITLQQPAIVPAKPCAYVAKQQNANTQNCTDCHAAVNKILVQPQVLLPLNGVTLNKVNGGMLAIDTTFKINDLAQFIILDAAPDTNGLPAGTVAPAFEVGRFDGKKVRLEDFKGKFVLLNFWDSSSAAAKEQMPHLRAAARDWSNEPNLVIIGINVDEKAARNFAKEERMDWMSGIGDAKVMQDYHLGVGGAVLIGPDGKIINGSVSGLGIDDALDKALRVGPAVPDTTEKRPAQPDLQNK